MKYKDYDVKTQKGVYSNGRIAIALIDAEDSEPIAMVTVNLVNEPLNEGEVFIKDYSENEGMLAWLIANGLAEDTGRRVPTGYIEVPVVKWVGNIDTTIDYFGSRSSPEQTNAD